MSKYDRLLRPIEENIDDIVDNYFAIKHISVELKFKIREKILDKISELINYVKSYMTNKIEEYNPSIDQNNSTFFPQIFHSFTIDLVTR